jgi:FKBP-type peptidyl-prolyl cis-trans isomerase FklB
MRRAVLFIFVSCCFFCGVVSGDELPGVTGEKDRASYSLGYQIGGDLQQQQIELNGEAFLKGVEDALSTTKPKLSPEEMQAILKEVKGKIVANQKQQQQANVEEYRAEGRAFLEQNAKREGVIVLPSGLQYKVIRPGTGKTPGVNDRVTVHYRGSLLDGKEFYNSRTRKATPDTFHVGAVIKGLGEALQLMKEGAIWQLYIPHNLAYNDRGPLRERTVILDVELISTDSKE